MDRPHGVGGPALSAQAGGGAEPAGWRWLLLVGSLVGAYLCVPETNQYEGLVWLLTGLLAVEVLTPVRFPPLVAWTCWGVLGLAAIYGATGRTSAVLGGLFSLVGPVVGFIGGRRDGWRGLVVATPWVVAAVVVARAGGIARSAGPAWWAVGLGGVAAVAVSGMLARRWCRAPAAG